jgi:hypothetical protein
MTQPLRYQRAPLRHKEFIRHTLGMFQLAAPVGGDMAQPGSERRTSEPKEAAATEASIGAAGPTSR